jgi:hypothetical protein
MSVHVYNLALTGFELEFDGSTTLTSINLKDAISVKKVEKKSGGLSGTSYYEGYQFQFRDGNEAEIGFTFRRKLKPKN